MIYLPHIAIGQAIFHYSFYGMYRNVDSSFHTLQRIFSIHEPLVEYLGQHVYKEPLDYLQLKDNGITVSATV